MQIQLKAPKIWLANEAVDFRKGLDRLCEHVGAHYHQVLEDNIYIFYNQAKNKIKLLAYHRNGFILICKRLEKKKFTIKQKEPVPYEINEKQLSWLLAGLDWLNMSGWNDLPYDDYF
jgi:transposase